MKYRVVFKEDCYMCVDVEAETTEEAITEARRKIVEDGGQDCEYGHMEFEAIEELVEKLNQ